MQNSNEKDFKKKYLKYKAKYLELKDLLEGGVPPKTEEDETKYPLLTKLKTLCTKTPNGEKSCKKISEHCKKGTNPVCDFSINEEEKKIVEAEEFKKLKSNYFMNKATYLYLEGKKSLEPHQVIDKENSKKKIEELEAYFSGIEEKNCKQRKKGNCTNDPKINGCLDGYAYGCNFDEKVFIKETLNKEFKEDKVTRMNEAYLAAQLAVEKTAKNLDPITRKSVCDTEYKFYSGEYIEYCNSLNKAPSFCRIDKNICKNHIR